MTGRAGAIAVAFVANGLAGPSFLARLPERKDDLDLSDSGLGLVLAGMALGALAASPPAGWLIESLGSRRVVLIAATVLGGSLWTVGAAPTAPVMFAGLVVVGAADAAMDAAMNANGAAYQAITGRSVLHRLHASWSLGALAAANLAGLAAAVGIPLTVHLMVVGAIIAGSVLATRSGLVTETLATIRRSAAAPAATPLPVNRDGQDPAAPDRASGARRLARPLLLLAVVTALATTLESVPYDWAALQLTRLGATSGVAALGFAAFMAGMLAARLAGDRLTDRWGAVAIFRFGMVLSTAGFVVAAASTHPASFIAGLAVAGVGSSWFFPLAYAAAARIPGVAPGTGAATVSLACRIGLLVEPIVVGALADLAGLRWGFALVAVLAAALGLAASRIIPSTTDPSRQGPDLVKL